MSLTYDPAATLSVPADLMLQISKLSRKLRESTLHTAH